MLDLFKFDSGIEGNHLLVLGAIHGDEPCGTLAIQDIMKEIEAGDILLQKGQVTFIPVCNPQAYAENKRFIDQNLNRAVSPIASPSSYEEHVTNALCPVIEECDVLLDLHSSSSESAPFAFVEHPENHREVELAQILGAPHIVYGAQETISREEGVKITTTMDYARITGGTGLLLECGQHKNPQSVAVARRGILNMLKALGMIDGEIEQDSDAHIIDVYQVFNKSKEGDLTQAWVNFDMIPEGAEIARYHDGESILAPQDGYVILPWEKAPIGQEWFYLGRKHV